MKRTEYVPFLLSEEERQHLDDMASKAGVNRSELIRAIIAGTRVQIVTPPTLVVETKDRKEAMQVEA